MSHGSKVFRPSDVSESNASGCLPGELDEPLGSISNEATLRNVGAIQVRQCDRPSELSRKTDRRLLPSKGPIGRLTPTASAKRPYQDPSGPYRIRNDAGRLVPRRAARQVSARDDPNDRRERSPRLASHQMP
jgi:hypothetical protein